MTRLSPEKIARMIDISTVKTESSRNDVDEIIDAAKRYNFICVFPMPAFLDTTISNLKEYPEILVGGVVGFPSGGETTTSKVFQAKENVAKGCNEIDMVMNIGQLKSQMYNEVKADIIAVKEAVTPLPLKVIIEVAKLTDSEIIEASKIVRDCGASFVKTGTGWAGATTLDHVKLIADTVGGEIPIKVAGGVRDLNTLVTMYEMGVTRFGIGRESAIEIMEAAKKQ